MAEIYVIGANIIEKDNKVLLMQETLEKVRGKWNLPAGRLEMKEDIIACAKREGEEETGFKLDPIYLVGIYQHHLTLEHNIILFVFKSEIVGGELTVPKDALNVKWFSFDEIEELNKKGLLRLPSILKVIQDYKAGKKIQLDIIAILDR
ncbi:MAG: NUDIX domain-containing protein [Candidatus Aenigmarchaeota archaeon]|nr:NUDIX domain-containing protein [Candidatus Aenigmarchaeota archaeon]